MADKDIKDEAISRGNVLGQVASLVLNPSKDLIKQFTYINRYQASLFPLMDTILAGRKYVLETQAYLCNPEAYKKAARKLHVPEIPEMPNLAETLLLSTAEWQKSIGGKNFEKGIDIALAEVEKEKNEMGILKGLDGSWEE